MKEFGLDPTGESHIFQLSETNVTIYSSGSSGVDIMVITRLEKNTTVYVITDKLYSKEMSILKPREQKRKFVSDLLKELQIIPKDGNITWWMNNS